MAIPIVVYDFLSYLSQTTPNNYSLHWFSNIQPKNTFGDPILPLDEATTIENVLTRANQNVVDYAATSFGFAGSGALGPFFGVPYNVASVWNPYSQTYFNANLSAQYGATATMGFLSTTLLNLNTNSANYSPLIVMYVGYTQSELYQSFLPAYPSLYVIAQLIQPIINGGFTNYNGKTLLSVSTCPCKVPDDLLSYDMETNVCNYGLYQQSADNGSFTFPLGSKPFTTRTTLGQCMATGNSMQYEGGTKPIFYGNAQIIRLGNLDKIRFSTVSAFSKKCNSSVVFSFIGDSCEPTDSITVNGITHNTAITAYMSAQVQINGQSLPSLTCPQALFPADTTQWCPNDDIVNESCLKVLLPDTRMYLTVEVPVTEIKASVSCLESVSDSFPFVVNNFDYKPLYQLNFAETDVKLDLYFNGAPIIEYPGLSNELVDMLTSLVSVALNTNLRETISSFIQADLQDFLQPAFGLINTINNDQIGVCFSFTDPPLINCATNTIPIIPATGCNACDLCCQCVQAGDCGQKCIQRCPCVATFCNAVERYIDPLWFFLAGAIVIIAVLVTIILFGASRGLKLSSLSKGRYW